MTRTIRALICMIWDRKQHQTNLYKKKGGMWIESKCYCGRFHLRWIDKPKP